MSIAELLGRSGDEDVEDQRRSRRSRPQLGLFRRKRPFHIEKSSDEKDTLGWDVVDLATGEQLGRVVSLASDGHGSFFVARDWLIGKYDGLGDKDFESVWAAADAIWKAAFPWRSAIWRLMSWFVLLTDYSGRGFQTGHASVSDPAGHLVLPHHLSGSCPGLRASA